MEHLNDEFIWVEKYRPKTINDTILPSSLKEKFQTFIDNKNVPNLLLTGRAGIGKTTVARAMLEELDCDYIIINGSMNGNIDTLRNDIQKFASSVSLMGGRKYAILDEADYLNPQSTQPALRNFMEEFSKNCGFILTCNFKNKIIEPLHSRCSVIEFKLPSEEKPKLASQFMARTIDILNKENVEFDKKVVGLVIKKFFPDFRRVLNELQVYSATGKIDAGMLTNFQEMSLKSLLGYMKEKNFTAVRKWVAENSDMDSVVFFRKFYDVADDAVTKDTVPILVLLVAKYLYQDAFAADKELNTAAFAVEVMGSCQFK